MNKITIAIRFSDLNIVCFKAHMKSEFLEIQNILFLYEEERFKEFLRNKKYINNSYSREKINIIEHESFANSNAFFAPSDRGIVFIDFLKKEVFSNNNYSPFLETGSMSDLIKDLVNNEEFINQRDHNYLVVEYDINGAVVGSYRLFKDFSPDTSFFFNLYHNFLNGGRFELRKNENDEVMSTYKDIEPIELMTLLARRIEEDDKRKKGSSIEDMKANFKTIAMIPKDWKIQQGGLREKELLMLYDKLSINFQLSQKEKDIWQKNIKGE